MSEPFVNTLRLEDLEGADLTSAAAVFAQRFQLLTVADLLAGRGIHYPRTAGTNVTYKPAPRAALKVAEPHLFERGKPPDSQLPGN